jgi:DSBA-like thioredoxin domain-containing protein
MAKIVDYFFTPVSPWTYLGSARLDAIVRKPGVELRYKPCDFGRIFPVSGGLPVAQRAKQRQAYRLVELERWRDHLGIKLNLQPKHFPVPSDLAARTIIAAKQRGTDPDKLVNALLRAVWADRLDLGRLRPRRQGPPRGRRRRGGARRIHRQHRRGDRAPSLRSAELYLCEEAILGTGPAGFPRARPRRRVAAHSGTPTLTLRAPCSLAEPRRKVPSQPARTRTSTRMPRRRMMAAA